jgi:dienelactone hydrolase
MKSIKHLSAGALLILFTMACNPEDKNEPTTLSKPDINITEQTVEYSLDTLKMQGYLAYDSSATTKMPIVLVVPEWWGVNDYTRNRTRQLAELGYVAMAVDMYGNGMQAENPTKAGELAAPFYSNLAMAKNRFDAALAKAKTVPNADTSRVAAIGYCFGGAQVLNMARLGSPLKAVVSFHGNLVGVAPVKETTKAAILVCHGEDDQFVPAAEVAQFKKQMDTAGIPYVFKSYPNATHAFTNPNATEVGNKFSIPIEYNAAADTASWADMKAFFKTHL